MRTHTASTAPTSKNLTLRHQDVRTAGQLGLRRRRDATIEYTRVRAMMTKEGEDCGASGWYDVSTQQ